MFSDDPDLKKRLETRLENVVQEQPENDVKR
jgi:hypothetical protein